MTDISINQNHLEITNGDFVAVSDIDEIKQHIIVALNTFYGDWILNRNKGIDYAYGFKHPDFMEIEIKKQILEVDKVQSINNFKLNFDRNTLALNVYADINTEYGNLHFQKKLQIEV